MTDRAGGMGRLLAELRRRNVFRVTGAYVIGVWAVLQVADVVFPPLLIPQWVITVLVVLAAIGLPLVVVLAWMFDITPTGVVRTQSADGRLPAGFHWNTRWIDYVIIVALLAILAFILTQARPDDERPPDRSIAVLPFADLSFDGKQGYFCDGMSEALIDSLGRLRELRVASRTSSFAYRDSPMDAREMASRLGVGTILEGSVRKSGNDVRIDARLVDGQNGYNLWNQSYEGTLDDIFLLQDKIARSIADVLEIKLLGSGELVETATRDQDAYDLFLRGRARLRQRGTLEDLSSAVEYFKKSLQRDPEFALAMAGLCTANWWKYEITRDGGQFERAVSVCESAAEYKAYAGTHVALARLYEGTGQLDKAHAALDRALELQPGNADAFAARGLVRLAEGALAAAEQDIGRAIELDPSYWRHHSDLGVVYTVMGRFDQASEQFSRAISLAPGSPIPYYQLGVVMAYSGEHLKAAEAFTQSIERSPTARAYSNAASNYFYSGALEVSEEMYREAVVLNPSDYRYHGNLAHAIALQGGRVEEASGHFEQAVELAYQRLEVNPGDQAARASVATYLAKLGRAEQARQELQTLDPEESKDVNVQLDQATTYLFLGESERAIEFLTQAALGGYPPSLMQADPNLKPLRDDPGFRALVDSDTEEPRVNDEE